MSENPPSTSCIECSSPLAGKQLKYCSPRCKRRAEARRYRQRIATGHTVPQRTVAQQLTDKFGPELRTLRDLNRAEATTALNRLATLAQEKQDLDIKLRAMRHGLEDESRRAKHHYIAARNLARGLIATHEATHTLHIIHPKLRAVAIPYLTEEDNPWA